MENERGIRHFPLRYPNCILPNRVTLHHIGWWATTGRPYGYAFATGLKN